MRVRMLQTRRGTEDGFTIRQYMQDVEYDMGDGLAYAFIAAGFAMKCSGPGTPCTPKKIRKKKPSVSPARILTAE